MHDNVFYCSCCYWSSFVLAVTGAHIKILLLTTEWTPDANHPFPNPNHWSDGNYYQS